MNRARIASDRRARIRTKPFSIRAADLSPCPIWGSIGSSCFASTPQAGNWRRTIRRSSPRANAPARGTSRFIRRCRSRMWSMSSTPLSSPTASIRSAEACRRSRSCRPRLRATLASSAAPRSPSRPMAASSTRRIGATIVSPAFAVDRGAGTLTPIGWAPTHANSPRFFGLDPAVKFLYAANADEGFGPPEEKNTDTIVQFRVEANGDADADRSGHQDQQSVHDRLRQRLTFGPYRVLSALQRAARVVRLRGPIILLN